MMFRDRLLTNVERVKKGITNNSACGLCGHDSKDSLHVISYCSEAKDIFGTSNSNG